MFRTITYSYWEIIAYKRLEVTLEYYYCVLPEVLLTISLSRKQKLFGKMRLPQFVSYSWVFLLYLANILNFHVKSCPVSAYFNAFVRE